MTSYIVEVKVPTKVAEKRKICSKVSVPKLKSSKDDGEWFNARTYLLNMAKQEAEQQEAKRPKLDEAISSPLTSTNLPTSIPTDNVVPNLKEKPQTSEEDLKFSDHMKDSVQTVCQICQSKETFVNMRVHTRKAHGMTITEYKIEHGGLEDHMVEAVYHRCRLCEKVLLLESDAINTHMKAHKFNMKEYSTKYMTLKKQQDKKPPTSAKPKLSIDGKASSMSAADLLD